MDSPVFSYTTTSPTVRGRDGKTYVVAGPPPEGIRPSGGWKAQFPVKGHMVTATGPHPRSAFAAAKAVLATNGIEHTDLDLWFNLRLQWVQRTRNQGRLTVREADLMALATGNAAPRAAPTARQTAWPPKEWGRLGWGGLRVYLAGNRYDRDGFLRRAVELGEMVNPDINPNTGCADCYRHYVAALEVLKRRPAETQHEARQWVFKTMNAVNTRRIAEGDPKARILTWEQAVTENHWH